MNSMDTHYQAAINQAVNSGRLHWPRTIEKCPCGATADWGAFYPFCRACFTVEAVEQMSAPKPRPTLLVIEPEDEGAPAREVVTGICSWCGEGAVSHYAGENPGNCTACRQHDWDHGHLPGEILKIRRLRGRTNPNEKCADACLNAVGDECSCACGGEFHGTRAPVQRAKCGCPIRWIHRVLVDRDALAVSR
jgi:hypothetical protein